jgi:hypothetical protein
MNSMKLFPDMKLSDLRNVLLHKQTAKGARQDRHPDIDKTVERVVDVVDGRIRLVGGYRKKLQLVIRDSLEFTDTLIDRFPRAIEVSSRTFVSDPYVNAFFSNTRDVQMIFSRSSEIRDFMEDYAHDEFSQCCALLCMHKLEKTVLGVELAGDTLKKDVKQTAVNFTDHRIYSPAPSEEETRQGLKQCLFEGLVTNSLERVVQLKLSNQRLQHERQMLQARLRHAQYQLGRQAERTASEADCRREIEETRLKLEKTENDLRKIHLATPQVSLEQVIEVFSSPEKFVRLQETTLRLNKMGIKISESTRQPANILKLTEVGIGEQPPRVVTLAKFPRDEFLSRTFSFTPEISIPFTTM